MRLSIKDNAAAGEMYQGSDMLLARLWMVNW